MPHLGRILWFMDSHDHIYIFNRPLGFFLLIKSIGQSELRGWGLYNEVIFRGDSDVGLPVGWLHGSHSALGDFMVEQKGKTQAHP